MMFHRKTMIGLWACALLFCATAGPAWAVEAETGADHATEDTAAWKSNPLSVDPDLAIFTVVVFVLLLAILWKFAWGPICVALDAREKRIADNIAAAENAGDDARKLIAQYDAKLASAADEIRELLEEARRDAEHTKRQIVAEAKQNADQEWQRVQRQIDTATAQALKELAEASADMAIDL
ncbi:MAG: F0F1 ATP synthase subunit B, partial [Planctomycetes bacterium]|nr:F0F1 ATP synthase subunit B [Planctomycetota bacterium]